MHSYANPWHLICLAFLLVSLSACGGGGEDDDVFVPDDADATGIWTGTNTPGGGSATSATAIVSPTGRFVLVNSAIFLSGTGSTSVNSLTANSTGWPPVNTTFANGSTMATFSMTGTVTEGSTLNASYSGANESGTLALTYDSAQSNKNASLATVAGSYMTSSGQTSTAISNGTITLNSTDGPNMNCIGNGSISAPEPSRNVYVWNMTTTGCSVDGAADGLAYQIGTSILIMVGRVVNVPYAASFQK